VNETLEIYGTLRAIARCWTAKAQRVRPTSVYSDTLEQCLEKLHALAEAGVTEFSAAMAGGADDRDETYGHAVWNTSRDNAAVSAEVGCA